MKKLIALTLGIISSANGAGVSSLYWNQYEAKVTTLGQKGNLRSYQLESNFPLRDHEPNSGKVYIKESSHGPLLRSGSPLLDSLFALTVKESNSLKIETLLDYNFSKQPCSCFKTGTKWSYVWTRDVAYATHLGLGFLETKRSLNSLQFKIAERRDSGRGREIIQDLGSGGSWPISTDRVTWALGAHETIKNLTDADQYKFIDKNADALVNTIETDRKAVFDANDGLYRGEQSFLDWREQSYPYWVKDNVLEVGMAKSLSTNINHYAILQVASSWLRRLGDQKQAAKYAKWSSDLKSQINKFFWHERRGLYRALISYKNAGIDDNRYELLGNSLAVLLKIADETKASQIVRNYPQSKAGAPVIFPQLPEVPIYHNRGIWPFVSSYYLKAATKQKNLKVFNHIFLSLMRGTSLNLSNMENFEFLTQHNYYSDGKLSGPVINSTAQLWSVAGFFSAVIDNLFGKEQTLEGIRFKPFVPETIYSTVLGAPKKLTLSNLPFKNRHLTVKINFPRNSASRSGYYTSAKVRFNGKSITTDRFIKESSLLSHNVIEVDLKFVPLAQGQANIIAVANPYQLTEQEHKKLFSPKTPEVSLNFFRGQTFLNIKRDDKYAPEYLIYRDGELRIKTKSHSWLDTKLTSDQHCYTIVAKYGENHSPASYPVCRVPSVGYRNFSPGDNNLFSTENGSKEYKHGKYHFNDWGTPSRVLYTSEFDVNADGTYLASVEYGNGNPVSTGITATVKRLELKDALSGKVIHSEVVMMPHLGQWVRWEKSNKVQLKLKKNNLYRIEVSDFLNMSYFDHFNNYFGHGGETGYCNRSNIAKIMLEK